jgi:hypothetical protein
VSGASAVKLSHDDLTVNVRVPPAIGAAQEDGLAVSVPAAWRTVRIRVTDPDVTLTSAVRAVKVRLPLALRIIVSPVQPWSWSTLTQSALLVAFHRPWLEVILTETVGILSGSAPELAGAHVVRDNVSDGVPRPAWHTVTNA